MNVLISLETQPHVLYEYCLLNFLSFSQNCLNKNKLVHASLVDLILKEEDFFFWLNSWNNSAYAVSSFHTVS